MHRLKRFTRGVEVGHSTIVSGSSGGREPVVRTGVTAVLPRGKRGPMDGVFAAWFSQNGNGEMTGTTWVDESGLLYGPVMITNTHSVGVVRDAVIDWALQRFDFDEGDWWSLPVVAETWDGWLNDLNGFHVKPVHAVAALDEASGGPVAEGNVGGGTGMICYEDLGSIIVVVATDAPLLPHQLARIARRATMGIARTGAVAGNGSGDIFTAFSTANPGAAKAKGLPALIMLPNDRITPPFTATVHATEEAIVNALVAARTTEGYAGHRVIELPHDRLRP